MAGKTQASLAVRLAAKTEPEPNSGCLLWTGASVSNGSVRAYGVIGLGGRRDGLRLAHRVAFELAGGIITPGLDVMHKCDVPLCVNPAHLSLGTRAENMRDSVTKGRFVSHSSRKTHCPAGHPYDESNTHRSGGRRICRACKRSYQSALVARDRDAFNARRRERRRNTRSA